MGTEDHPGAAADLRGRIEAALASGADRAAIEALLREASARLASVDRDVAARADAAAPQSAWLHAVFDHSVDGILFAAPDGRVFAANPAACAMVGRTEADLCALGRPGIMDLSTLRGVEAVRTHVTTGEFRGEVDLLHADGSRVTVDMASRDFEFGALGARTIVVMRDLSERLRVERALAESHARLLHLTRLAPGVLYQFRREPDGRIVLPYVGPGFREMFGLPEGDTPLTGPLVGARVHPDDRPALAAAAHASRTSLTRFRTEYRVLVDGPERWVEHDAHPEPGPDGSITWHSIVFDVTARRAAQREKAALEDALDRARTLESIGRLAGGVAHDFNNMLGVIIGCAELASDMLPDDAEAREEIDEILRAARRSADLTRQLLAVARRQNVAPRRLDLSQALDGTIGMLRRLLGEDFRLEWSSARDLFPVRIDPAQVDQVLTNLCVNARDAMAAGGTLTVRLDNVVADAAFCARRAGLAAGDYVRLVVTDTGSGIDEATLAHIFEPFYTTKGAGKGTGLGLATVYGIVQQNRGFVDVVSRVGEGTSIEVFLPRDRRDTEDRVVDPPRGAEACGHETILVVEDEPALLRMITHALEGAGYRVLAAATPTAALELAARHGDAIALLVTDVVMPERTGPELAAEVRARCPGAGRLFMSGYAPEVIARRGGLDDGAELLQKPFSVQELARRVRAALDGARG